MTRSIDSRTTYEVWNQLIRDEALAASLFEHRHVEAANQRGFSGEQLEALQWFHDQPGTRWNLENLRFRAALETGSALSIHLPRTLLLLTGGDEAWLQDIAFEYLSYYQWDALGHYRLSECVRFAAYTRDRIVKRRATPRHLEAVLELELAVVDSLAKTAEVPAGFWTDRPIDNPEEVALIRPQLGPTTILLTQDIDLRPIVTSATDERALPGPGPVTWLIHVASTIEGHRMKVIGDGVAEILTRCDGASTSAEIAAALEVEFDLPAAEVAALIARWLGERILSASA